MPSIVDKEKIKIPKIKYKINNIPEKLIKEFHPTLNKGKKIENIQGDSTEMIWWKCSNSKCGHNFRTTMYKRVIDCVKCPQCNIEKKRRTKTIHDNFDINNHIDIAEKTIENIEKDLFLFLKEKKFCKTSSGRIEKDIVGLIKTLKLIKKTTTTLRNFPEKEVG